MVGKEPFKGDDNTFEPFMSNVRSLIDQPIYLRTIVDAGSQAWIEFGLTPFYVPLLMRVVWCSDRTWGGRSVAESGPSSAANSAGVLYPVPLCNRS